MNAARRNSQRFAGRIGIGSAAATMLLVAAPAFATDTAFSAVSPSFRLVESTATIGGGTAVSATHRLVSCLNHDPTGSNASASFRLQSGCGVASALQGATAPLPIPLLSTPLRMLLLAALLAAAAFRLRRQQRG